MDNYLRPLYKDMMEYYYEKNSRRLKLNYDEKIELAWERRYRPSGV